MLYVMLSMAATEEGVEEGAWKTIREAEVEGGGAVEEGDAEGGEAFLCSSVDEGEVEVVIVASGWSGRWKGVEGGGIEEEMEGDGGRMEVEASSAPQ